MILDVIMNPVVIAWYEIRHNPGIVLAIAGVVLATAVLLWVRKNRKKDEE